MECFRLSFVVRWFVGAMWVLNAAFAQSEAHLSNLRQLSFGGDNAEAYFSFDGKQLVFQSNNPKWGLSCDQIFILDIARAVKDTAYKPPLVSTGKGRTTCSYFMPGNKRILFGSTHANSEACPAVVQMPGKYLWNLYDFDIFTANTDGSDLKLLAGGKGYQAEATVSPTGDRIVYTSDETGDLELWTMAIDGSDKKQITTGLGYDGGAFFSPDGKQLVFRASRPQTPEEVADYKDLLSKGLIAPTNMEIYVCNVDGSALRQVTHLGKANWAPFFHPSGKKIIFSSNHHSQRGYDFQLYMINVDGTGLEQVTYDSYFNAFPMFSPDGKHLVFSSNRNNKGTRDTNLFIADWVEGQTQLEKDLMAHITYLASDKLRGRATGSKEEGMAAKYIAKQFQALKLKPASGSDYMMPFTFKKQAGLHDTTSVGDPITANNVAAFLDNGAATTVIIGGHYDHLGMGYDHNSREANPEGKIHNGADDNASGTAGVLELARYFTQNDRKETFNFLFVCFSGEELGLIGSKKFCENLPVPKENISYMVNLDMIGRLDTARAVTVGGVGTAKEWGTILDATRVSFSTHRDSAGIGPSDHTSFYLQDIPVLFLFTGAHEDYHKPTDDVERINGAGAAEIVRFVMHLEQRSEAHGAHLTFQKTRNPQTSNPRFKVALGIMPSYSFEGKGVKADAVTDGKPAAAAGVKAGDIVIRLGDVDVMDMQSYMKALGQFEKGNTADLVVMRNGERVVLKVQF